jgi:hypothetical protein
MESLAVSSTWQKVGFDDQTRLLAQAELHASAKPNVSRDSSLLDALDP